MWLCRDADMRAYQKQNRAAGHEVEGGRRQNVWAINGGLGEHDSVGPPHGVESAVSDARYDSACQVSK
jgi:hypothetical protein